MTEYKYAAKVPAELKQTIALAMEAANEDWEKGFAVSPDQMDMVRIADLLLMERYDGYPGSTPEGRQFLADDLYERQSAGELNEWSEMAEFVVDCLVAE